MATKVYICGMCRGTGKLTLTESEGDADVLIATDCPSCVLKKFPPTISINSSVADPVTDTIIEVKAVVVNPNDSVVLRDDPSGENQG